MQVVGIPLAGFKSAEEEKHAATDSIKIDLELSESPARLRAELWDLTNVPDGFHHLGEVRRLQVTGTFADDREIDLRCSKLTTYEINPPGILSIDDCAFVTAVGNGSARITIK